MNLKIELVAMAVRLVSEKSSFIAKPDPLEALIYQLFGGESYDQRLAREIVDDAERAVSAVKQLNVNRKFKKIVKSI